MSTATTLVLYDTGPGLPGRWDLVGSVILPSLRASGHRQPDLIVLSHNDYDHAGGIAGVRAAFPGAPVLANPSAGGHDIIACHTPIVWTRPDLHLRVLHPSPGLPYLGNLSSCVLSLATRHHSVLLPGDIEQVVEERLVRAGLGPHTVLVAPHHGSETSSGASFIRAVDPDVVLIAAGAGNRFGFPRPGVVTRYRKAGSRVVSVSDCGALRVGLATDAGPHLVSARRERMALWRWPPDPACP